MTTGRRIFIGDLQGCREPLERLLDQLRFDPGNDHLFFAGDLVNRGGQSLETLRLVYSLRERVTTVLGNHDLHLLAYVHGKRRKANAEFDAIAGARDGEALLDWLRHCPLIWLDAEERLGMVHAGIDPRWSPEDAQACASELERALREAPRKFFAGMYGDKPTRWRSDLGNADRLRSITNVLTRMRFCRADGRLALKAKGGADEAPSGYGPWFDFLHPDWEDWTLVFGHWSQLGLYQGDTAVCLDSGCVWGGSLSALVVEADGSRRVASVDCGARQSPTR